LCPSARSQVRPEGEAVFLDARQGRRCLAPGHAAPGLETLEGAGIAVGPLEDALAIPTRTKRIQQGLSETVTSRRQQLKDAGLAVAVDDHPREQVGFGMDLSIGGDPRIGGKLPASIERGL